MNSYDNQIPEGYRNAPDFRPRTGEQKMASAALFLGITAVCTCFTVYLPFILGSLAIVFALLSKGAGRKLLGQAKIAIGLALGGFALVVTMCAVTVSTLMANPTLLTDMMKQYDQYYEQMYGESTEDAMGISFENMAKDLTGTIDTAQN